MNPKLLYKYRSFEGFWRSIFTDCGFWFSVARHLDDDEEVAIEFDPAYLEDRRWTDQIRNGCSLLSLAMTHDNRALWDRYGDQGRGFCVEADFQAFHDDGALYFTDVSYIDGPARVVLDKAIYRDLILNPDKLADAIWRRLYFEKDRSKWSTQNEVRFLQHKEDADNTYPGFLKTLPAPAIKRVFFQPSQVAPANLAELMRLVAEYRDRNGHEIELVEFKAN